jgi:ribosome-binding protein aMBF1 (putative translation factor)
MSTVSNTSIADKLSRYASGKPSKWRERFTYLLNNQDWLRYSAHIALRMLDKMDELGMTQKELAEKMGCTQQRVSKIMQGHENLSLETLFKIEQALGFSIIREEIAEAI